MKRLATAQMGALVALLASNANAQGISGEASADGAVQLDEIPEEEGDAAPAEVPQDDPAPPSEPAPVLEESSDEGTETDEPMGDSDHDQMVGTFAVGYLGRQTLHWGTGYTPVVAPIIGVRYWLDDMIGIDGGIGLNMLGGKATLTDADDVKAAGHNAFLFHVGVPINLADSGHFSFQVVPETNLGFVGTGDQDTNPDDDLTIKSRGTFFNIGAKVGAELHFGFMNVPQLSLQGNVGLYLQTESVKDIADNDGDVVEATDSYTSLGTTVGNDPWDVFTSSISALYYFK